MKLLQVCLHGTPSVKHLLLLCIAAAELLELQKVISQGGVELGKKAALGVHELGMDGGHKCVKLFRELFRRMGVLQRVPGRVEGCVGDGGSVMVWSG